MNECLLFAIILCNVVSLYCCSASLLMELLLNNFLTICSLTGWSLQGSALRSFYLLSFQIDLGLYIKDDSKELSVLVDRSVGGASIKDGQLELMLHRFNLLHFCCLFVYLLHSIRMSVDGYHDNQLYI